MNCLNCQNEVPQQEGRRAKLYCSDKCKSAYHRKGKSDVVTLSRIEYEKFLAGSKKITELNIRYVDPLTTEQEEAIYNATHEDSKVFTSKVKIGAAYYDIEGKATGGVLIDVPDVKKFRPKMEGEECIDYNIEKAIWEQKQKEDLKDLL